MFTGIIREMGTVMRAQHTGGLVRVTVQAPQTVTKLARRESVSVNGVCLSVVALTRGTFTVEVIRQTQRLTSLGALRAGSRVNLEPSLSLNDRLGGHFVLGHIDGTGTIAVVQDVPGERILHIRVTPALRHLLVPKGCVALDGVSLTVGETIGTTGFTVHLIPETLRQTTLHALRTKSLVNVEVDYLAKLVAQVVTSMRKT